MASTVLSYPIPPYSNPPIEPQFYKPKRFVISAIVTGGTTTITTSENHDYVIAQQCRIIIPQGYGSRELNEQIAFVINIPAPNQVVLDLNSQNVTPFVNITTSQLPQLLAIGDVNTGAINRHGRCKTSTKIPGSFINISPDKHVF